MSYKEIIYEIKDGVALITLNRPDKLNAYTPDMGEELVEVFRHAIGDDDIQSIILTGKGRGFCAGADRAFLNGKVAKCGLLLGQETFIRKFVLELARSNKPLIAAVNGVASGIGVTMILPFDFRVASIGAYFDFPFVKLGITPGLGSSYYLPRLIGMGNAIDVLLNSRKLTASDALELGLVSKVVPASDVLEHAWSIAQNIADSREGIVSLCKDLLVNSSASTLVECVQRETTASTKNHDMKLDKNRI